MGRTKSYESEGIVVRFDARRCIHAAECVHNLPSVFDADRRPWIDATAGAADEIARTIERCPSGALTYERTDGGPAQAGADESPQARLALNGPLYVRGGFELVDGEGSPIATGPRVALCRCGASKNKPFCDNSHLESGFSDGR